MSRTGWKAMERTSAALFGANHKRFPANQGHRADFEGPSYIGQCKNVRTLSLAALEALAVEMERLGAQSSPPKIGVVVVKRSAGVGRATPHLVVLTEHAWREMAGRLPQEDAA